MKPPTRSRSKPPRFRRAAKEPDLEPAPQRRFNRVMGEWKPAQKQRLLNGLKALGRTQDGSTSLDYTVLHDTHLPSIPVDEIQSMVQALQSRVASHVSRSLHLETEEQRRLEPPIELWVNRACRVTGELEEPIVAAFTQMLTISSMEPLGVSQAAGGTGNLTPGRRGRAVTPVSRTSSPLAVAPPEPALSGDVTTPDSAHRGDVTAPDSAHRGDVTTPDSAHRGDVTTPDSAHRGDVTVPTQVTTTSSSPAGVKVTTSGCPNAQSTEHTEQVTSSSTTAGLQGELEEKRGGWTPSASPCVSTPHCHALPPSHQARHSQSVSFSKLYRYLSTVDTESPEQRLVLTDMESAVVLDLLMSLPEELHLLDGSELQRHFMEVYEALSSPPHSTSQMFPGKAEGSRTSSASGGQTTHSGPASRDVSQPGATSPRTESPSNQRAASGQSGAAPPTESPGDGQAASGEGRGHQGRQSSSAQTESTNQGPSEWQRAGLSPLNPFRVPIELLARHTDIET